MPRTTLFVQVGQRIGRGVVIETGLMIPRAGRPGPRSGLRAARLVCDCGNEYVSALQALVGKRPESQRCLSCGCLRRERQIAAVTVHGMKRRVPEPGEDRRVTHGMVRHPLYKTWEGMIARCERPNATSFEDYGGRGIKVCERWHDPRLFAEDIERDLGPRPEGCSLNRIDNEGNYEPGNVEWATWTEQAANRRPMAARGPRGADPRPYAKTCEQCGNPFQAARTATMFCSKACKARHRRAARKDDIEQTCHQCGGNFTASRYDGIRHCSHSCAATCQHAGSCPAS